MSARVGDGRAASRSRRLSVVVVALLCAAPVPGDIGACGQPVEVLDAPRFFAAKKAADCRQCRSCGIRSGACDVACDDNAAPETAFPDGCLPLVHDGEVCLRGLLYASCTDYRGYMDDAHPRVPTECDFCPRERR